MYIERCLIDALLKKRLADGSDVGVILKDVCVAVAIYPPCLCCHHYPATSCCDA